MPADAPPTADDAGHAVSWRIEVWGRVKWGPDFMRPFGVTVVADRLPAEPA